MKKIDFGSDENFISNYQKLKSAQKMSDLYGCSKTTILNHAKKIGYDTSNNKEIKITLIPIEQIIADYEELQSADKVGSKYGCSGTAVRNYLEKNNYKLTKFNSKTRTFNQEQFILDYNELKSADKMAKIYNCSDTTILNYAKKIGYDPNSNKKYKLTEEDKIFIINSYNQFSSTELANKFNVSRGMITKIWFDNNLIGKDVNNIKTTEIDITNQDFGYWHVLYKTDKRNAAGVIYWHCRCKCGVEKDVLGTSLRSHTSLSCGNHSNVSKGNFKIMQLLKDANIPFETEKKFKTCKDQKEMPFDFYVNNSYLIEYDGIQHFEESVFDYGYTHKHDLMKSEWCKKNNIPLIRIPYIHYDELCLNDLKLETSNFIEIMPM